jgi:hypothetical protein
MSSSLFVGPSGRIGMLIDTLELLAEAGRSFP